MFSLSDDHHKLSTNTITPKKMVISLKPERPIDVDAVRVTEGAPPGEKVSGAEVSEGVGKTV
jgi:hypothetical protein